MKYLEFVPHKNLETALGRHVSVYREKLVECRRLPEPVYGILERSDDVYILRKPDRTFVKLEEGEGVFVI
ncbi:MAG: hypothetical protein HY513_00940 [Candidatus Aenigmarchaeota archaeon]|nr:hypothetical protein [Candidatus Aenigmarchaeota archaeon]